MFSKEGIETDLIYKKKDKIPCGLTIRSPVSGLNYNFLVYV